MSIINDPALVREQYAHEGNLQVRQSIYATREGPDAREGAFEAVAAARPRRVLEVGGGQGELAERLVRELGVELVFIDQSARMVEIARAQGLDASVGDVQALPFSDGEFDCAVAAWMLYHVPDVDLGLSELARVLRAGGTLVAVTNGLDHLGELRELAGGAMWGTRPFTRENGGATLAAHFAHVERHDLDGSVSFPDDESILAYLGSLAAPPASLPPHELPFRVRTAPTLFVATK